MTKICLLLTISTFLRGISYAADVKWKLGDLNAQLVALTANISKECASLPEMPLTPYVDNTKYAVLLDLEVGLAKATLNYTEQLYKQCQRARLDNVTCQVDQSVISGLKKQLDQLETKVNIQDDLLVKAHRDIYTFNQKVIDLGSKQSRFESMVSSSRVHQYTWPALNDDNDDGELTSVEYIKEKDVTGLRVSWSGNIGVYVTGDYGGCNRWYFKFNGYECNKPVPIDLLYFAQNTKNIPHVPASVDGVCSGLKSGKIKVSLHVGTCTGYKYVKHGDAYTGFNSPTRLLIEEVKLE